MVGSAHPTKLQGCDLLFFVGYPVAYARGLLGHSVAYALGGILRTRS